MSSRLFELFRSCEGSENGHGRAVPGGPGRLPTLPLNLRLARGDAFVTLSPPLDPGGELRASDPDHVRLVLGSLLRALLHRNEPHIGGEADGALRVAACDPGPGGNLAVGQVASAGDGNSSADDHEDGPLALSEDAAGAGRQGMGAGDDLSALAGDGEVRGPLPAPGRKDALALACGGRGRRSGALGSADTSEGAAGLHRLRKGLGLGLGDPALIKAAPHKAAQLVQLAAGGRAVDGFGEDQRLDRLEIGQRFPSGLKARQREGKGVMHRASARDRESGAFPLTSAGLSVRIGVAKRPILGLQAGSM